MNTFPLLFLLPVVGVFAAKDYTGYKVIRVTPSDDEALAFLHTLDYQYDIWKGSRGVGHAADIMVSSNGYDLLMTKLQEMRFQVETKIQDVQPLIDQQMMKSSKGFSYTAYNTLDEVEKWMDDITNQYSNISAKEAFARSYEDRSISKIKISSNLNDQDRPIFFIIGGTHSREWITQAAMIQLVRYLLTEYDPSKQDNLIDIMEFHVIPVFNVDGYNETWTGDRMWRKTRKPNKFGRCVGTDPNRNYDNHWGTSGTNNFPCSQAYMGTHPVSEIEIKLMQDHVMSIKDRMKVFIDVHAYSEYWMYPYGWTVTTAKDRDELDEAAKVTVQAISKVHGRVYEYGPISVVIYPASGNSADWAYDQAKVKHSYALELRDTGDYGLLLPASEIQPNSEELNAGIDAFVRHLDSTGAL